MNGNDENKIEAIKSMPGVNRYSIDQLNKILNKEFKWNKPLILIQGLKDNVVTPDVPEKIIKKVKGNQIQIKLLKNSDHRLSDPFDLKIMNDSIQ